MPTNRKITTSPPLSAEGFADLSAVRGAFGRVSTSASYAWIKQGTFPTATAARSRRACCESFFRSRILRLDRDA